MKNSPVAVWKWLSKVAAIRSFVIETTSPLAGAKFRYSACAPTLRGPGLNHAPCTAEFLTRNRLDGPASSLPVTDVRVPSAFSVASPGTQLPRPKTCCTPRHLHRQLPT